MKEFKAQSFYLKYDENNTFLTYKYIATATLELRQAICVRLTDILAIDWKEDSWVDIYADSLEFVDKQKRLRLLCVPHKERELLFETLLLWFVQSETKS